jgi:transcriptional regulator with XRE-family HTH domain
MPEEETLGQRIRRLRAERGMSLAKVVKDDFSRAFLNQVELGKARPSLRVLRVIAQRLGTEVEFLLEGTHAGVERELALERARVLLLRGEPHRALLAIRPALNAVDWPFATDVKLCQAEALLGWGKEKEAKAILARELEVITMHEDRHRLDRLRAIQRGEKFSFGPDPIKTHLQLAERAQREADNMSALEHYRAARVLLDATPKAPT